ncbi:hypothetical protein CDH04_03620 [Francisella adeliensis]|nr:hypothetical protein CDH04_03620 [Francisella adeliensis]
MSLCTASTLIVVNKEAGNIPEKYMSNIATNSNGTLVGSIVDSLYDAAADEDPFTFTQNIGGTEHTGVNANCTDFKCTVTEINGERWMVQEIPSNNQLQLYKEDSDDAITLYSSFEGGTTIDTSREDAEQLQQVVDESMALFDEN